MCNLAALSDLAGVSNPRLIDGILLTKFDTIDDKVRCFAHYRSIDYRLGQLYLWCTRPASLLCFWAQGSITTT